VPTIQVVSLFFFFFTKFWGLLKYLVSSGLPDDVALRKALFLRLNGRFALLIAVATRRHF
ncbi:MAG: hypothetical protein AB2693_25175, partial [Candidatus Thiodiazotropha sp.]